MNDVNNTPVLSVRNLSKRFVLHERGQTIQAFEDLSFDAGLSSLTALVGASGSGKSSALKCVYRTYLPQAGAIDYLTADGRCVDLATADEPEVLALRQTEVRLVSQFLRVLPRQTTRQVVARPLVCSGVEREQAEVMAQQVIDRIGLPRRLWDLPPATFSGGERQLVNFAQALVMQPRLLLLDEPTASLDVRSTEQIVEVIEGLKAMPIAMVAVFHNRQIVQRLADKVVTIEGGVVWETGKDQQAVAVGGLGALGSPSAAGSMNQEV